MARSRKQSKGAKRAEKVRKRKRREEAREQRSHATEHFFSDRTDDEFGAVEPVTMPDRRAVEGAMWREFGGLFASPDSPLGQAQELMYQAFDVDDPDERAEMAKQALEISPDCADAYVVLAEQAGSLEQSIKLYEQGVEAGRRAIGDEFESHVGHFWGVLPTRPYMRARDGLAGCLWAAGRRDEAIEHFRDMLRLNPNDNMGIRYVLAPKLIESGRLDQVDELFRQFGEDSAQWLYNRALCAFRREGESRAARQLLDNAIKANRHVPTYVTGQRMAPLEQPDSYAWGSDEEARIYDHEAAGAWKSVPGAVAWLRKVSGVGLTESKSETKVPDPDGLRRLPQESHEIWRVDVRQLPGDPATKKRRPFWSVVALSTTEQDLVASDMFESKPSVEDVWDTLCSFMAEPELGEPRRPGCMEFLDERLLKHLSAELKRLRIDAVLADDADEVNARFEALSTQQPDDRPIGELPQVPEEVWQVDCRQTGVWVPDDEGNRVRPWVVLVTCPTDDMVIAQEVNLSQPSLDEIWNAIELGMRRPVIGAPRRPGCVQVRSADQRLTLEPRLDAAGVACEARNDLDHWDKVYSDLAGHMEGRRSVAPYVELPGVESQQVGSFFEAAAGYFRSAPWQRTPTDSPIELDCDLTPVKWYAVVMGQNGQTFGLALYDDWKCLHRMLTGRTGPEEAIHVSALSLTFGEQHELAGADLDAAEQFGWPVAAPEAYPVVFRVQPGEGLVSPTADELRLLEAAVRAVPQFVAGGSAPVTQTVSLSDRSATVALRWKRS